VEVAGIIRWIDVLVWVWEDVWVEGKEGEGSNTTHRNIWRTYHVNVNVLFCVESQLTCCMWHMHVESYQNWFLVLY